MAHLAAVPWPNSTAGSRDDLVSYLQLNNEEQGEEVEEQPQQEQGQEQEQ